MAARAIMGSVLISEESWLPLSLFQKEERTRDRIYGPQAYFAPRLYPAGFWSHYLIHNCCRCHPIDEVTNRDGAR